MSHLFRFDKSSGQWSANLPIVQKNVEQQLAFGWASVVLDKLGRIIVDHDDDIIPISSLEKGAYAYVATKRQSSDMHEKMGIGTLIESVVLTPEKRNAMGLPPGEAGWWVGFHVNDRDVWEKVRTGVYAELSIGGSANRVPLKEAEHRAVSVA